MVTFKAEKKSQAFNQYDQIKMVTIFKRQQQQEEHTHTHCSDN